MNTFDQSFNNTIVAKTVQINIGKHNIINNVDFTTESFNITGIIGPNGSGKSTLLKAFYKALKPSGGIINICGHPLEKLKHKECARFISVLHQHQSRSFDIKVNDAVYMGLYPHKNFMERENEHDKEKVKSILKMLGIENLADRFISSLSGGETQIVMLARALVQDTPFLLLDEPTNHLDIKHQLNILDAIKTSNKKTVVVFHDLSLAGKYCDYIYIMKNGRIFKQGTPADIINKETISAVYDICVEVVPHPVFAYPCVIL